MPRQTDPENDGPKLDFKRCNYSYIQFTNVEEVHFVVKLQAAMYHAR
jgi:hypothetical protein